MSRHIGIFIWLRGLMKRKLIRFGRQERGAIAVEMAFILPIFAAMAFLTYDAGTVYTQYKRGTRHYYAMGDILSAQTQNVTCSQLDKMSELVYDSYAAGNWARRSRASGSNFTQNGALDFRFAIKVLHMTTDPADNKIKGRIEWAYWRHGRDMDTGNEDKPGDYVEVPEGLRIAGIEVVYVDGSLFIAPSLNYLGIFDFNPGANSTHKIIEVDRYFPLRFRTGLDIDYSNNDPLSDKCWVRGQSYPQG